jgi:hypothetical protein
VRHFPDACKKPGEENSRKFNLPFRKIAFAIAHAQCCEYQDMRRFPFRESCSFTHRPFAQGNEKTRRLIFFRENRTNWSRSCRSAQITCAFCFAKFILPRIIASR